MIESLSGSPLLLFLLLTGFFWAAAGCRSVSRGGQDIKTRTIPVQLGDATVKIMEHRADSAGITYVNLHDDENTSVKAVLQVMRREGGRLVELQHSGKRNITFEAGDSTFAFDPNRMFTEKGRRETLARYSSDAPPAYKQVAALADSLLAVLDLDTADVVVAAHNNTDNSREGNYSARSYSEGEMQDDAAFSYLTDDVDADDFFFVTERALYDRVRNGGFNVVMQDNKQATDDGSLSVYCGHHGVPYVNVEAQHGHLDYQYKMLLFLNEALSRNASNE